MLTGVVCPAHFDLSKDGSWQVYLLEQSFTHSRRYWNALSLPTALQVLSCVCVWWGRHQGQGSRGERGVCECHAGCGVGLSSLCTCYPHPLVLLMLSSALCCVTDLLSFATKAGDKDLQGQPTTCHPQHHQLPLSLCTLRHPTPMRPLLQEPGRSQESLRFECTCILRPSL